MTPVEVLVRPEISGLDLLSPAAFLSEPLSSRVRSTGTDSLRWQAAEIGGSGGQPGVVDNGGAQSMDRPGRCALLRLTAAMTLAAASLAIQGCATLKGSDPLQVTVAGIEPLESQGMEARMLVKLRVQNPNDAPVDYNGVSLEMNVSGKTLATGVSDASGTVPRFGEAIIAVPITASAFRMLGGALSMMQGAGSDSITYEMNGKLSTLGFTSTHFQTRGEFAFPKAAAP